MPYINTSLLTPESSRSISSNDLLQIYNGLDVCITTEVHTALQSLFNTPPDIYQFELAMQGPALEMMLRGFRIDEGVRQEALKVYWEKLEHLDNILQEFAIAIWDKTLNARSPKQLLSFFYSHLHISEVWTSRKGERKLSMNRETLEKIGVYFQAQPIVNAILAIRDTQETIKVLTKEVDFDGRMRTSFNIAGTETGRWSSSTSSFWNGMGFQNITPDLRNMFISDPGYKLCVIDLEQTESRDVGWLLFTLFGDSSYLDACEGGDLHTAVSRMTWKDKPWTPSSKDNRAIADQSFSRHFSFRDAAKRLGHGSNYLGTAFTMAKETRIPLPLVVAFQKAYFTAFPGIPRWHRWVAQQIQTTHQLETLYGRRRHFFGRVQDDATLREAIAYGPQGTTADRMNLGLYRIWKHLPSVQCLAQVYDAVVFQYPEEEDENAIVQQALKLIEVPLHHNGRTFIVPGEAKVGWNWGYRQVSNDGTIINELGLQKWNPSKPDTRQRLSGLDKTF